MLYSLHQASPIKNRLTSEQENSRKKILDLDYPPDYFFVFLTMHIVVLSLRIFDRDLRLKSITL